MNLAGQFHPRIARTIHDPVTATALALEGNGQQAVLVSCDLVAIRPAVMAKLRQRLSGRLTDLDPQRIIVSATHTHTAPDTRCKIDAKDEERQAETEPEPFPLDDFMAIFTYRIREDDVMQPEEYVEFLADRLADVVAEAWGNRRPGGMSWGLGHAVIGFNRRPVYDDGRARMYGNTTLPTFSHIEGYEDHGVELLFFWDEEGEPTGMAINIACPSQVVEGESSLSADFWHDVREELRARHGERLFVLGLTGACGDQSPHPLFRQRAEATRRERCGLSETRVLARRIAATVDEILPQAREHIHSELPFEHHVETLPLPMRKVTDEELEWARREREPLADKASAELSDVEWIFSRRYRSVIERHAAQQQGPSYPVELHVLRLGDVALATNPFELFLDYGMRIKARSPAEQTLVVELACGCGGYLPTARAVAAGGYGAEIVDGLVGLEGGEELVERTVEVIAELWEDG